MENYRPTHLLSTLGVLSSFRLTKKVNSKEVTKTANKLKRLYKDINPEQFDKLLVDALIENAKKTLPNDPPPPGLIIDKKVESANHELDKQYLELTIIAQTLSRTFTEKKMNKHQMCFIINALVSLLKVSEDDFNDFHKKFQKYKDEKDEEENG